jgi:hypothetical protein
MSEIHIHIVSFSIPYPPNYGGAIDVFYKIRALYSSGVKVHLHCFIYDRDPSPELEKLCFEVHYYPRKTGLASALTWKPYIVYSRRSDELLCRLLKDDYPVIFEGLHSCYYLSHPALKNRVKIYRESNIEHHYYYHLSKAESNLPRKLYFILSSLKLRAFQGILSHATLMLTVSSEDNEYLARKFPSNVVEYLPSFHKNDEVNSLAGKGNFVLYHGNLSIAENRIAAEYLVKEVFRNSNTRFVIAGMNPSHSLAKMVSKEKNIKLIPNPSEKEMFEMIRLAHVNILVTFQPTGLKLKLLNALFTGRYCLVNPRMVIGTELGEICETAENAQELKNNVFKLMQKPFSEDQIRIRTEKLMKWHSNKENCIRLLKVVSLFSGV